MMKLILPVLFLLCVCCKCSPRMTNDLSVAPMPGPPRTDLLTAVPDVAGW